jgi:hypothetical protein
MFIEKLLDILMFFVIGLLVVGLPFLIYAAATDTSREDFMTECMIYKKKYECTYMWKSGERSNITPIPMVVPIR